MTALDADGPNAAQVAYWNESAGPTWVAMHDALDHELNDLGLAAMAALAPRENERLVDIGCGCGATTLELARRVGKGGAVLGVDLSAPMLAVARERAAAAGLDQASFLQADAQVYALEPVDGAFSRFGVMFFADPVAAFANIRKGLRPGGRVAFVCWRQLAENPWMTVPMAAVLPLLPAPPAAPTPDAPGPFAFADRDRLFGILPRRGLHRHRDRAARCAGQLGRPRDVRANGAAPRSGRGAGPREPDCGPHDRRGPHCAAPHVGETGLRLGTWIVLAR